MEIAVDRFIVAIAYTAHFSEVAKMGRKRLPEFMEDLFVTVEMFRTGEYTPEDYKEELEKALRENEELKRQLAEKETTIQLLQDVTLTSQLTINSTHKKNTLRQKTLSHPMQTLDRRATI